MDRGACQATVHRVTKNWTRLKQPSAREDGGVSGVSSSCGARGGLLSPVQFFVTLWTVAHQAPPLMGFPRREYWSGLPFPSPWDLPNPGMGKPGGLPSMGRWKSKGQNPEFWPAGPALLLALCRPAGPGAPARMGHPPALATLLKVPAQPHWPQRGQSPSSSFLISRHCVQLILKRQRVSEPLESLLKQCWAPPPEFLSVTTDYAFMTSFWVMPLVPTVRQENRCSL